MYKKAKLLKERDKIAISDTEELIIAKITKRAHTIQVYGFINYCTDGEIRNYSYEEYVKISVPEKQSIMQQIMEFVKKCMS